MCRHRARRLAAPGKWRPILAIIVVAGCALPAGAVANVPSSGPRVIKAYSSIDGVSLGESYAAARAAWGKPVGGRSGCTTSTSEHYCFYDDGTRGTAGFFTYKGRVVQVYIAVYFLGKPNWRRTPLDRYQTPSGIGLGSTYAAVKRAYPGGTFGGNGSYLVHGRHGTEMGFTIYPGPKGKGELVGSFNVLKQSPIT